jgi:hypothetical protein
LVLACQGWDKKYFSGLGQITFIRMIIIELCGLIKLFSAFGRKNLCIPTFISLRRAGVYFDDKISVD